MEVEKLSIELEKASQLYAEKFNIERDSTWFILKLQEEVGELTQSYLMLTGQARTKGMSAEAILAEFHREVADVFGQTLLLARFYEVDLEKEIEKKWLTRKTEQSS